MPNDNSGDIQIKPAGGTANAQGTAAASQQSNQQAQPVTTAASSDAPAPAASTTTAPQNIPPATVQAASTAAPTAAPTAQPTNTRAFNLEADVDDSSSGPAKPEKYAIPKMVKEKYADLVELIKTTESMDDQEREYWFQIMPIMTADQIEKFRNILITEKTQLQDLDKEYEDELNRLNEKHLLEWKEFESKEKSKAIKEAESANEVSEKQLEEDLLAKLSDV